MRYNEVGINIDSIDKLILDIYNYAERINKTLNQITDVVEQTRIFYDCASAKKYREKFNNFSANFNVINTNLKSYAEDMIKLKNKYQRVDENLTDTVKRAIINMQNRK